MTLEQRIAYYVGQGMDLMMARRNAEEDIRERLSEIKNNNNSIRTAEGERQEALRNAGSAFGNIEAVGNDVSIEGVNTNGIIVDERTSLENDLSKVHAMISNAEQGYLRDQYLNDLKNNEPEQPSLSDQLKQLQERETEIRERLAEIRDYNNNVRMSEGERQEAIMNAGSAFGNIEAIGNDIYQDINNGDFILSERENLQNELTQLLTSQSVLAQQLRQEKIEQDKLAREDRLNKINKKGSLEEAYKFFTYLDTDTSKGYDVSGLTNEEVIDLYNNFRTDEKYRAKYEDTIAKMQEEEREVVIPDPNGSIKPSDFAAHLFADGSNPMFPTIDDAIAYAAAHPELAESWTNANSALDNENDEPDFEEGIPPETAQAGVSEPANETLKERFKGWFKKNWRTVVAIAAGILVVGVTAAIVGDAMSAQQVAQDVVNQAAQTAGNVPVEQTVPATQMFDPTVDMSQVQTIYSDAYSAAEGTNALPFDQSAGQEYVADLFNPTDGKYAGVDTSNLSSTEYQQLQDAGYTVSLMTNDPSMLAADGNTIANAGAASGFGGPTR